MRNISSKFGRGYSVTAVLVVIKVEISIVYVLSYSHV